MAVNSPLVTVITPTYNRADRLRETLDSVLAQDYPQYEVIVIDDGSTDTTRDVLTRYGDRIRWEYQPNAGEASAVNRGFALANGELIAVVNSDDPVLPGWLRAMAEAMTARPELLAAYPDWIKIDTDSQPISPPYQREYDYTQMLVEGICLIGPGALIRRSALALEGGRDPRYRYVGDFDFWLRLGLHGEIARVPRTLATFRVHDGSASESGRGVPMATETAQMIEQLFARDSLPSNIRALKRPSLSMAYYMAGAQALRESQTVARGYFIRSMRLSPLDTLRQPKRLTYALATVLLPNVIHRPLFRLWKRVVTVV